MLFQVWSSTSLFHFPSLFFTSGGNHPAAKPAPAKARAQARAKGASGRSRHHWAGIQRAAGATLLAILAATILPSQSFASDLNPACQPLPHSGAPAAPNTLIASQSLPNSNPATELNFIRQQQGLGSAVEVPCSFTGQQTSGTWSSGSDVTHILVKAGTLHQIFSVNNAPTMSGVWTTQCIVNNLNSLMPQDISHGRCYASRANPNLGRIIIRKTAVDGDGNTIFQFTGELGAFPMQPPANGTVSRTFNNVVPGSYTVSEVAVPGWSTTLSCIDPTNDTTINGTTVTISVTGSETVECEYINRRRTSSGSGSITVRKTTIGGEGTFSFESSNAALTGFNLTTVNGSASRSTDNLPAGNYEITETVASGWTLTGISCTGGSSTSINVSDRTATVNLLAGEDVTCTFVNTEVRRRTQTIIRNFMKRRGDLITSNTAGPRLLQRNQSDPPMTGSIKDSPMKLGAKGDAKEGRFEFAASLRGAISQQRQAAAEKRRVAMVAAGAGEQQSHDGSVTTPPNRLGYGAAAGYHSPMPAFYRSGWDVWISGAWTHYNFKDDGDRSSGNYGQLKIGVDYLMTPGILVGVMAHFDRMHDKADLFGYSVKGTGWMIGPYAEFRLTRNLIFDVKGLWGRSTNEISPFLTYTDEFETDRWLASARLTGSWRYFNWHFTPTAEVIGYRDKQKAYTDSNGILIPGQTISFGRVIIGPEISYRFTHRSKSVIEPKFGVKGVWTFTQSDGVSVTGPISDIDLDRFRLRLEAGLTFMHAASGTRIELSASQDGLGGDQLDATTGRVEVTIPLNR